MTEKEYILFYKQWHIALIGLAFTFVKSEAIAEDIVSDSLVKLYINKNNVENGSAKTWINQTIKFACFDWLRNEKRHHADHEIILLLSEGYFEAVEIKSDLTTLIINEIRNAPPRQRKIMELKYIGYDYDEIADTLHISVDSVRVQVHRFRNKVKPLMALNMLLSAAISMAAWLL